MVGQALERRQRGHAPEIINISWRAQRRLNARWRQLKDARHKPGGIVAVAIARELAAYCWEIATWSTHPDPVPPASLPAGDPLTQATSLPPKHTRPPAGGSPTHANTPLTTPLRLARRPEHPGSRTPTPRFVA